MKLPSRFLEIPGDPHHEPAQAGSLVPVIPMLWEDEHTAVGCHPSIGPFRVLIANHTRGIPQAHRSPYVPNY